jgi:uncharacterized membrane protein YgaE (UPF0421/DUF939 family)
LRSSRERLLTTARPIVHTAVAAALAWLAATTLLGHETPFFAPIAATVTLGVTIGQRGRRAVELAFGVAVGIAVADALVLLIGTGTIQIAVVVALAMIAAQGLGGSPLLVSQAAVSAVLVATLQPPSEVFSFDRFLDGLTGGVIALAVAAVILPVDPVTLVRRGIEPVLDELAYTLDEIAEALAGRDAEAAERALVRARAIDPSIRELRDALDGARDSARLAFRRRRARRRVRRYEETARNLDLAVRNVRVLARGAMRAISLEDRTPQEVVRAVKKLAVTVRALGPALDGDEDEAAEAADAARLAAASANAALEETGNMSALHMVGQLRSTAVDLLRAIGMDRADAVDEVRTPDQPGVG